MEFSAGDNVVAVASMGNDPIAAHCSELMRLDKMLSAADVRAGKVRERHPVFSERLCFLFFERLADNRSIPQSPFDIPLAG